MSDDQKGLIFVKDMRIEFAVHTPDGIEWCDLPIKAMSLDWGRDNPAPRGEVLFGVAPWLQEYIPNPDVTWSITATTSWWPPRVPSLATIARRLRTSYPGLSLVQALRLARYARSRGVV
jgi:hypothetical protein